ncbi:MAG: OmpA family protein [Sulfurimonas sp.]|nr:OmpA family protein [Sulfurimonas sp.]
MVDDVGCPISMTIRLNFEVDSFVIPESSNEKVLEFAEFLKDSPAFKVHIVGHTDSTASEEYNQVLSLNRANALKTALLENGITQDRMKVSGEGELSPIETNDTAEGRAINRRTEVKLLNEI